MVNRLMPTSMWQQLRAMRTTWLGELQLEFAPDAFTVSRLDRPETGGSWNAGTASESWLVIGGTRTGKLRENGAGGPELGDGMVYPESPYVLRAAKSDDIRAHDKLTFTNHGDREFIVDIVKIEDIEDPLVNCYLHEVFA